jgi:dephospho-CoA kinase
MDGRPGHRAPDGPKRRVLRVALTGGIATGKSHCLRTFAALGVPVIDADVLARDAVRAGTRGFQHVTARFGADLVGADGELDRAALGRIVFNDPAARRDLEAIIHPQVFASIMKWFDALDETAGLQTPGVSQEMTTPVAIADVPLLFETGHADDFDAVVVVACGPGEALRRLVDRDGLSLSDAKSRLNSQIPIEEKVARADHVIDTTGSKADTDRRVREVLELLRQRVS